MENSSSPRRSSSRTYSQSPAPTIHRSSGHKARANVPEPQQKGVQKNPLRPPSPKYYSLDHKRRHRQLEQQLAQELKALYRRQQEDRWTKTWNLHKEFRTQLQKNLANERKALGLCRDGVVKQNTRHKFAYLRKNLLDQYLTDKATFPRVITAQHAVETQALRDKFYQSYADLRKEAKTAYHREIFDKILIPAVSNGFSRENTTLIASSSAEAITGQTAGPQTSAQPTEVPVVPQGSDIRRRSLSVTSRRSGRSSRSAQTRRPDAPSIPSTLRLQDTPLLTKTLPSPSLVSSTGEAGQNSTTSDPVPVKRNFWGKIIG